MNKFLRGIFKSKKISREVLENNLKNWTIGEQSLSKTFKFDDFKKAMTFLTMAGEYMSEYGIKAKISNVYNKVDIIISGDVVNHLTTKEMKAAVYLDEVGVADPIEEIVKTDYSIGHHAFPEQYNFDNGPKLTDPYQKPEQSLLSSDKNQDPKLL